MSSPADTQKKPRVNNFPFPFLAVTYHNPLRCGSKTYLSLINILGYFGFGFLLLLNLVLAVANILIAGFTDFKKYLLCVIMATFWVVFGFPIAFFIQYWPTYSACASKSSARYFIFFICEVLMVLFIFFMFIGIPHAGSCGLISAGWMVLFVGTGLAPLSMTRVLAALFNIGMSILWIVAFLYHLLFTLLMINHFRLDNGSLAQASGAIIRFVLRRKLTAAL